MDSQSLPRIPRWQQALNKHLANCDVCNEDANWGSEKHGSSTSSLTRHLKSQHRPVFDAAMLTLEAGKVVAADVDKFNAEVLNKAYLGILQRFDAFAQF